MIARALSGRTPPLSPALPPGFLDMWLLRTILVTALRLRPDDVRSGLTQDKRRRTTNIRIAHPEHAGHSQGVAASTGGPLRRALSVYHKVCRRTIDIGQARFLYMEQELMHT